MSREKSRRIDRLEARVGGSGDPTAMLLGLPLSDDERVRMWANWREVVAAGEGVSDDGTRYRARLGHGTLYIMPEPLTVEEWIADVRRSA